MYVYVRNNPVNGVDALGYSTENISPPVEPVKPNGQPFKIGGATISRTYDGKEITLQSGGKAHPVAGSAAEYTLDGSSYIAVYGKQSGYFIRYALNESKEESRPVPIEPIEIETISPTDLSIEQPIEEPSAGISMDTALDGLQLLLGGAGMIPVFGEVADFLDAGVSLL